MLFLIALSILLGAYILIIHNKIMHYKTLANEYWPQIEVFLKQRLRLTAHLLQTVKGAMQHEKEVVTALNAICLHDQRYGAHFDHLCERMKAELTLSDALTTLLRAAQNYPDLMSNESFLKAKTTLSSLENVIQEGAYLYNAAALEVNQSMSRFPNKYIMMFFEVERFPYFLK